MNPFTILKVMCYEKSEYKSCIQFSEKHTNLDKFLDKPIFLDKEDNSLTWKLPTYDNDKYIINCLHIVNYVLKKEKQEHLS